MNNFIKTLIKELTPPILLTQIKRFVKWGETLPASAALSSSKVAMLKERFDRDNRSVEEGTIILRSGLTLRIHPDCQESFRHFCYRSPEMVEELDSFIALAGDRRMLLDIGALHGIFSLVFATRPSSVRAIAVDASPVAFGRLLYNIHKNQLHNILPVECALSAEEGTLRMHYEWEHAVAAESNEPPKKYLSVKKQTVDNLCANLDFQPDVIKIDVEGHEVKVVMGAARTLERNRPMVFLELHPLRIRQEGDQIEDLLKVFEGLGYCICLANGERISREMVVGFTEDRRLVFMADENCGSQANW